MFCEKSALPEVLATDPGSGDGSLRQQRPFLQVPFLKNSSVHVLAKEASEVFKKVCLISCNFVQETN